MEDFVRCIRTEIGYDSEHLCYAIKEEEEMVINLRYVVDVTAKEIQSFDAKEGRYNTICMYYLDMMNGDVVPVKKSVTLKDIFGM